MGEMIHMDNVTYTRNGRHILTDLNWRVKRGEHWAIIGLNGSGKTTLLNMINGYIWPSKGQITVLGHLFGHTDVTKLRESIGWVSSSLETRIKGTEPSEDVVISGKYASIGLYQKKEQQDIEKAHTLIESLGCTHLIGHDYQTCSQGEKQRLLIARSLMASPKLLILDEPTNGLDFLAREQLLETIHRLALQKDAPTILFVTHHIDEVLPVFSHTLLLRKGQPFAQGETKDMLTTEKLSAFLNRDVRVAREYGRVSMSITAG